MSIEKITNYVMNTPYNTNKSILVPMLKEFGDQCKGATILWENPNPTTRVDEGNGLSVEIDFSEYKIAQLICRKSVDDDATFCAWLNPTKKNFVVPFNWTKFDEGTKKVVIYNGTMRADMDGGSLVFWGASITEISMTYNTEFKSVNNFTGDYMIPQMIIGYK